ncbi:DUF4199 domain-containing protein [Salegentibacter chungangensis]|uniref:DUF4199 domain-containing protein n=1 Tax=Salegentibacter chungangensis TaxID=1335724 RepID=A0ABW3NS23_9FLAO
MKKFIIEIKWGFIFIITNLLWAYFEKTMGWHNELIHKHPLYTNFFAFIAIGIYLLALAEKRKKIFNGIMSWQQGFVSGIVLTVVITILSPLSQYLINEVISPEYFNNIIAYSTEKGKMSRENAEAFFNLKSYILQGIFMALALGVVTSAFAAYILKRKKN